MLTAPFPTPEIAAGISNMEARIALLGQVPIFAHLSQPALAQLAQATRVENVDAGRDVFKENDPGQRAYIVVKGGIDTLIGDRVQHHVRPGEVFGETALLSQVPRTATARATKDSTLLSIGHDPLLRAVEAADNASPTAPQSTT